jgi:hypothetical protein
MENTKVDTVLEVTIKGGSGDFNVVVYDNLTDQYHTFESVKMKDSLVAQLYFGERVVLEEFKKVE